MDGGQCVKKAYESILHGDYELAEIWFEQAVAAQPVNPEYHHKCSITCLRNGKLDKALRYAEEALRLDPDNGEWRFHLNTVRAQMLLKESAAILAADLPDYGIAIARLREATELDPLLDEGYLMLAAAYGTLRMYEEATRSAKEALKLNPQHAVARRLFADYNRRRRQARERHKQTGQ
ncbi:hypothetical protein DNH61_23355 [Paenibacillus sambharensis]|uniref:Uncharacterized protein n=1 Tax=Paenibacillus sambharensis TaxID=1803190 RepID=A0A2W1L3V1_9BACL|nr:tetratricopeptide repeat protein [Paenibacillus sambharensis]PZD93559.1 hypothetical protein DNH61_23355 [Paenibacillus sambharensis]